MKRWICQICNKSFINEFCGILKTFIRDSTLCENCKLTNYTIVMNNNIILSQITRKNNISSSNQLWNENLHISESSNNTSPLGVPYSTDAPYEKAIEESSEHSTDLLRKIVVQCNDISNNFNDYYVRTTLEEISRIINKIGFRPLDEIKRVFGSCLREILQYDNNTLQKHCRTNSQEWKYWCSDVIIYFICRKIIFNKPIPICKETLEIPENLETP